MLHWRKRTWILLLVGVSFATEARAQFSNRSGPQSSRFPLLQSRQEPEIHGPSLSATEEPVVDIRIVGNRSIATSDIASQLKTRVGRPFDPKLVQRDVRKLASLTWFVDVQPLYEKTPKGRIVIFKVAERPTIRYVEFFGNRRIRDKKLAKEIDLKVGGSVDPYAVEEARRKIAALYKRNGFNETQVTILEGSKPADQGVVFIINEGVEQRIWKVEFVGADFVGARRLKTKIESKPPTAMLFKGFLDREQVDADVDRLTRYYRSFGFFQAKVGRKIELNDEGTWATLKFVIHEGPRYNIRNVTFMGNQLFKSDSLAMGLTLPADEAFEQARMNNDVDWLKELYGSQGYVFADIRAEPVFLEEPGQLDLVYHIDEGKRWRVGRVIVHIGGDNPHTRIQTALNRLSLEPGQIMDIREVRASERRLQASGLFLADAAQGVMPKITFRIPELDDVDFTAGRNPGAGDSTGFRGQSPTDAVLPAGDGAVQVYEARRPTSAAPNDDLIDVHLYFDKETPGEQSIGEDATAASPDAVRHVVRRPPYDAQATPPAAGYEGWYAPQQAPARQSAPSPYGQLNIRSQSPYQPATSGYGGQLPGATGPEARPIAASPAPIQQVQYNETLPPPPGTSVVGPPVTGPFGPPPEPIPQGQPVLVPDPNVTPLPGLPQLGGATPFAPGVAPYQNQDPAVDVYVDLAEAQTGRFMIGAGINSDAGVVGQILLDERNFDWRRFPTSWDDFASGRAFRGGGQRFRLEAAPGTEVQRYLVSFQEPYLLDSPISFGLSGSYFDRRFIDWDEQRVGGRVSLGYQWVDRDLSTTLSYRGEQVKIFDPSTRAVPELTDALGSNALHGFRLTVANDTRDSAFFATEGHYIQASVEQVVGTFEYPRAELDARAYFLVRERPDHSGRHVLSFGTRLGFSGNDTPIYEHFFAGGYSTLRGFDFRGASPVKSGVQVGGEFMWVNTIEYLFPLTADDMMHGVVFVDYGTVEEDVEINDFRVSPGLGLRIAIPAMGPAPIALDFAWGIERAPFDDLQVFSFNVGLQR